MQYCETRGNRTRLDLEDIEVTAAGMNTFREGMKITVQVHCPMKQAPEN